MKTLYVFILCLVYVKSQEEVNCVNKETCSECIQTLGCIWCTQPNTVNVSLAVHCMHESLQDRGAWCPSNKSFSPIPEYDIIKNDSLQSQSSVAAVQIKPQRVKLSLRKDQEFVIPFEYKQAENYPVDLYYIMDLSASMIDHKEKLAQLGEQLSTAMRRLTTNFKLGFGSFVDKTDMPFISTVPANLKVPCTIPKNGKTIICVPPYSFINHMSLTDNSSAFSAEVLNAQVSGNLDYPEGGLDAVMQAMVCKNEIGWRDKARHLIVFSTDADFHIAGDGKLAGVVEPNDAKCHMKNNKYIGDLDYDYPSISQINYVAKQNNINLIFAIVAKRATDRVYTIYQKLHDKIENSAIEILSKNSDNVVSLVADNYKKIVNSVVLTDDSGNDVEIKYSSNCLNPRENGCGNVYVGDLINFTATIRPLNCLPPGSPPQIIKIKPEGIDESLEIELEVICDCPCEKLGNEDFVSQSDDCTKQGDLQCGVCKCNSGRFGRYCQCDSLTSSSDDDRDCKAHTTDTEVCSGLGACKCGKCECHQSPGSRVISGKFCECDNFSCQRKDNKICNDNGNCVCGKCGCFSGWTGDACDCLNTNATCIDPKSGSQAVCNGNGECVCGQCYCSTIEGYKFSGQFCQDCLACPVDASCSDLQQCSKCKVADKNTFDDDNCNATCSFFGFQFSDEELENEKVVEDNKICKGTLNSNCDEIIYKYGFDDNKKIAIISEKCGKSVDVFAVIFGVVGSIVLAGIVLLIVWKIFTVMHDRREFAKFEEERAKAKWHGGGNPLYKEATSEFKNPMYQS